MERVIVAFEQDRTMEKIRRLLEQTGTARTLGCRTAAEVKVLMAQQRIPTVICGYKLPDASARELFYDLPEGRTMLLVAPRDFLRQEEEPGLIQVGTPLSRERLLEALEAALSAAGKDLRPARSAEEEELVRRAKIWLMERYHLDEGQAHRALQKKSMGSGQKLADTARRILERDGGTLR